MKALRLLLASESARRVDLLTTAGYEFEATKSGFPELLLENPAETVEANAKGKALAVARDPDTVVLGADTIVYVPDHPPGSRILGQARDGEEVRQFIDLLQGRTHEVYSGVAVVRGEVLTLRHAGAHASPRSRRDLILRPPRRGRRQGRRIRRAGKSRIFRRVDRGRLHQRGGTPAGPHRQNARQRRNPPPVTQRHIRDPVEGAKPPARAHKRTDQ